MRDANGRLGCDHADARVCIVCYPGGSDPREAELTALRRRVMNQRRELRRLNRALAAAQKSETAARIEALRGRAKGEVYYDVSSAFPKAMLAAGPPERSPAESAPQTCGETRWGVLTPVEGSGLPVRRCILAPMHTSMQRHTDGKVSW